jgi:protease IV
VGAQLPGSTARAADAGAHHRRARGQGLVGGGENVGQPAFEQFRDRDVRRRPIRVLHPWFVTILRRAMTTSEATRLPGPGRRERAAALVAAGVAAASLVSFAAVGPARAQQSDPETRPTRGPLITNAARAGDADATAVELNPGSIGLLTGGSLEVVGAGGTSASAGAARHRRGAGLYWAAPVFGPHAVGFGLTGVVGVTDNAAFAIDGHTTLRLAYALRLGRSLALGAAWGHIWSGRFAGTDTFDFGLSARFGRYAAFGVTVEDTWQPVSTPRLWNVEVVARPTGTDRLELAIGAAHANADEWARFVPRARVSVMLVDGLRLYAEGARVPVAATPLAAGALALEGGADSRLGVGMALDFGRTGGAVGVYGRFAGSGADGGSVAGRVHINAERQPELVGPWYVVRVSLDGIDDDRTFVKLVRRVRALAADKPVAAVLFKVENVEVGTGRIEEVRDLMGFLRAHGKQVFAYAPSASTREYYLASAADAIVMHPAGELGLTGLSQSITFYKGAMDRVGVKADLVRIGSYKGSMEPFVMTEQSPDVRANKNRLLDDVFERVIRTIALDRARVGKRVDMADVRKLIDRGLFTPTQAQLAGLIDGVADQGQLETLIARAMGRAAVGITDLEAAPIASGAWPSRRVAVVLIDGTIVDGPSQELPFGIGGVAGSDTVLAALEECRQDPTVGAVVLRVNSPGGSAFASDVIARAIVQIRAAGKPVVVSMGDTAASGGYYVSAPADVVFASPSTVTGSIGIFALKVNAAPLMSTLGINIETYRRGARADYMSPYRPWTEAETKMVMEKLRNTYGQFLETVAAGRASRGLTVAKVDEIGRGQVYTGALAQSIGLVDKLGGLGDAIDEAVRRAGIPVGRDQVPEIHVLPRAPLDLVRRLVAGSTDESGDGGAAAGAAPVDAARLLTPEMRGALRMLAPALLRSGGAASYQARLPYDIEIR